MGKRRTIVQLEPEQAEALKRAAERRGVSMAAVVRDAVGEYLSRTDGDVRKRAIALIGAFRSKEGDIGRRHDEYLVEDYLK